MLKPVFYIAEHHGFIIDTLILRYIKIPIVSPVTIRLIKRCNFFLNYLLFDAGYEYILPIGKNKDIRQKVNMLGISHNNHYVKWIKIESFI